MDNSNEDEHSAMSSDHMENQELTSSDNKVPVLNNATDGISSFNLNPDLIELSSASCSGSLKGYVAALSVWKNKPQVTNRRLRGGKILHASNLNRTDLSKRYVDIVEKYQKISTPQDGECNEHAESKDFSSNIETVEDFSCDTETVQLMIREVYPKQIDRYPVLREAIVLDVMATGHPCTFIPLFKYMKKNNTILSCDDEIIYQFQFHEGRIKLSGSKVGTDENSGCFATAVWLKSELLEKICRWSEVENLKTGSSTLLLVPVDKYNDMCSDLKKKYGFDIIKNWSESTDPQKFVNEDIGIASYLLLLWEEERRMSGSTTKQSFVDLGCGNGLLVYLLCKEGHPGKGIDLRKRKIWDTFSEDAQLQEMALTPSAENLFPEYDWLIGNHSDELTPWIPVIAARSSYSCRYFVLPCCHHDFDTKFSQKKKGMSQYESYLEYVKQVGQVCGFDVKQDTLRIPSTKKVCLIGASRTYPESEESEVDAMRTIFIAGRCNNTKDNLADDGNKQPHEDGDATPWSQNFTIRPPEIHRNCVAVDQNTKDKIVNEVFQQILNADDKTEVTLNSGKSWNRGGLIPLSKVASLFDAETLQKLKSEDGGIQTLLRNHNNIFQVSEGCVRLRDFSSDNPWSARQTMQKEKRTTDFHKISLCWFHEHHPDGCPRDSETCSFAHGKLELRPRPPKSKKNKFHH